MRKHIFSFVLLVGVLVVTGFGCNGLSAADKAALRPVRLQYWTVYDNVDELRRFAAEYKQLRPYVTIDVKRVRYEEFDSLLLNALADDVAPDIISIQNTAVRGYESRLSPMPASVTVSKIEVKGKYSPQTIVTPVIETMPTVNGIKKNFVATVASDAIVGNTVYGIPLSVDTLALYYNKDLLDKSGIPLAPTTWDEFFSAVKKTTKVGADGKTIAQSGVALGTGNNIDNVFDILSLLMLQNSVPMVQGTVVTFANGLDGRDALNHPSLQALRFYTDFARPEKEVYSWNADQTNAFEAFVRGQSVFYFGYAFDRARIRSRSPQMNLEVIPIPQLHPDAPVSVANYWIESVLKKSKHQNEAWDFVRFITTPTNIKRYADKTGVPSPLREHIASSTPALAPFTLQLLSAQNWYHGKDIDVAKTALKDLVTDYNKPYTEKENPFERDANLIIRAARTIQQTM